MKNFLKRCGFTLVEIMFVIAIIAILLGILVPAMNSAKESAKKVGDISRLKKIAEAWKTYTVDKGFGVISGTHGLVIIQMLAGRNSSSDNLATSEKCMINDPNVYFSPGDKYASPVIGEAINVLNTTTGVGYLDPWNRSATSSKLVTSNRGAVLSYCVIGGLPATSRLASTPCAFTRGLKDNGTWDETGLYGTKGGFVAYCDGHVAWFDGDKPASFLKWNVDEYTNDIREAIPAGCLISCGYSVNAAYISSDGHLVLLQVTGTGGL